MRAPSDGLRYNAVSLRQSAAKAVLAHPALRLTVAALIRRARLNIGAKLDTKTNRR